MLILKNSIDAGFLTIFLLMLALNIDLFIQIRRKNRLYGSVTYQFKREKRTIIAILTFFLMSYGVRFLWDFKLDNFIVSATGTVPDLTLDYRDCMVFEFVIVLDGASFLVLLLFHLKNFRSSDVELQQGIEANESNVLGENNTID